MTVVDEVGRMLVMARVRPFNDRESNQKRAVTTDEQAQTLKVQFGMRPEMAYRFDAVFDESASQADVFRQVQLVVDGSLEGYNCSIFTYGQTGTGKTHTILGHDLWALAAECSAGGSTPMDPYEEARQAGGGQRGLIPRTMQHIFHELEAKRAGAEEGFAFQVAVTYLEIYNEKVRDLLVTTSGDRGDPAPAADESPSLDIRADPGKGLFVPGATEVQVMSLDQVLEVLWSGAKNRAMSATDMNAYSSRSHTIMTVFLDQTWPKEGRRVRSKCSLVDLAGSEKWKSHQLTKFSANRIKELTSINQSLSSLSNCISALLRSERGKRQSGSPRHNHIPYRDSKLTRLLQDSLGGNTKTAFVVTLSPAAASGEETLSTLQFAARAMRVHTFATSNMTTIDGNLVQRYQNEIARLKALLRAATGARGGGSGPGAGGAAGPSSHPVGSLEDQISAEMAADLEKIRDDNLQLLQDVSDLRSELALERREKQQILESIYGVGEDVAGTQHGGEIEARSNAELQMKVLQIQKNALAERVEALEINERAQEDRWQWLEQYHSWLRSLPFDPNSSSESQHDCDHSTTVTLRDRLSMMETSVVMQSQELKRTKELFLRHNSKLQDRLDELGRRHSAVLRMKCSSGSVLGAEARNNGAQTPSRLPRKHPQRASTQPAKAASPRSAWEELLTARGAFEETNGRSKGAAMVESQNYDPDEQRQTLKAAESRGAAWVKPARREEANDPGEVLGTRDPLRTSRQASSRMTEPYEHRDTGFSAVEPHTPRENPGERHKEPGSERKGEAHSNVAFVGTISTRPTLQQSGPSQDSQIGTCESKSLQGQDHQEQKKKKKKRKPKHEWSEHLDQTTNLPYYHNRITKETTWVKPAEFPGRILS